MATEKSDNPKLPTNELKIDLRIRDPNRFFLIGSVMVFFLVLIRNAWISDDAFITMRVIDNLVNGHGLTWNVGERVQAFTNPLWLFFLTFFYLILSDPYTTIFIASFIVSVSVVVLLFRNFSSNYRMTILGLLLLITSKALMDYSTSGLENPLTHLLMVVFLIILLKLNIEQTKRVCILSLIASLAAVNRLDTILIFLPVLGYEILRARDKKYKVALFLLAGFIPLVLWELFALIYYGFPFPNTYYAKIGTGMTHFQFYEQGKRYFENSLHWDPVTVPTIGMSLLLVSIKRDKKKIFMLLGGVLYLLYVISIGGDFMSGRFFSAIFLMSVVLILDSDFDVQINLERKYVFTTVLYVVLVVGLSANASPLLIKSELTNMEINKYGGVADEKLFYFQQLGLLNYYKRQVPHNWGQEGEIARDSEERLIIRASIGSFGYYAGPDIHVLDPRAISDPLLARLPISSPQRVGHYERPIPPGYIETLNDDFKNHIRQPELRKYYKKLLLIIRGDVFDPKRIKEIIEFNTGEYAHLVEAYIKSEDWLK